MLNIHNVENAQRLNDKSVKNMEKSFDAFEIQHVKNANFPV